MFILIFVLVLIWILLNPIGRFGLHFFGFTVYSGIPFPYVDLKIYSSGVPSIREKSHFISYEEVEDLLDAEILIMGIGYDRICRVDKRILNSSVEVKILDTENAIKEFNRLRNEKRKVAAIIHSTC